MNEHLLLEYFVLGFVGVAAGIDLKTRKIPNNLIALGFVIAIASKAFISGSEGTVNAVLGAFTGLALFIPLYACRGMAAGDVKLMMVVGAFVGPALAIKVAIAAFLFGGIGAILILWRARNVGAALWSVRAIVASSLSRANGLQDGSSGQSAAPPSLGRMAYGPAIALATAVIIIAQGV